MQVTADGMMDGNERAVGSTGSEEIDGDTRTTGRTSDGLVPIDVNKLIARSHSHHHLLGRQKTSC
jgi:hypothetical protein